MDYQGPKFIVVTGGVISGLGKGITSSSIGLLLQSRDRDVTCIKIDPYLNVDAGTMSPYEHGETYVLADGGEADLDLGNYERFLDIDLTRDHNITSGKIYQNVINKERQGKYLGKTVQLVPHVTNEIQEWIIDVSQRPINGKTSDICIIEVGGTIGDMETAPFVEALRQLSFRLGKNQFCFVHVSMIVDNGEMKTKPTQQSVQKLRSLGISPDILVMRSKKELTDAIVSKLSMFCHIKKDHIISNIDVPNIYYVPNIFEKQELVEKINKILKMKYEVIHYGNKNPVVCNLKNNKSYCKVISHFESYPPQLNLMIAGKYTGSQDTYLSLIRAIEHASFQVGVHVNIVWFNTEKYNDSAFYGIDGVIIPGGFGSRGIEGKISVARYARENNVPLLGICLGMQIMVVEYARSIGNLDCDSTEWNKKTPNPIIDILPNQTGIMGGTMRLGNYETQLEKISLVHKLYGEDKIVERHRHRYEVNNKYVDELDKKGLFVTGTSKANGGKLMEVVEYPGNRFYIGCQYHPEFRSRYNKPHPLFVGLLEAMKEYRKI